MSSSIQLLLLALFSLQQLYNQRCWSIPVDQLYPYGPSDQLLLQGDDLFSEVRLKKPLRFFGEYYSTIYVNTNGIVSFLTHASTFLNVQFPLSTPSIAPLYSNVDTTTTGKIYFRETEQADGLERSSATIRRLYPNLPAMFTATRLFIVTWEAVGYYPARNDKMNTFQLVISSDSEDSFVEFLYVDGGIQWVQAISKTSLPELRSQAGIIAPNGALFTLKGSATEQVVNLDKWTNADTPGLFVYRIGYVDSSVEEPHINALIEEESPVPKTCAEGYLGCHANADCFDEPQSVCCRCKPGFFGNGVSCLSKENPLRLSGRLWLNINGIQATDLDFQGYIVVKDGRVYTAVDNLPPSIGTEMQLLNPLESVVGWLFAVSPDGTKNGFEITGGSLNHTAILVFDERNYVRVHQQYQGIDPYDQIKVEVDISGNIPRLIADTDVSLPDYGEHYTKTERGVFRSQSKHFFKTGYGQQINATVEHTITYHEECGSAKTTSHKLTSFRNYISFNSSTPVLRLASFHKLTSSAAAEDPCIEGRAQCVANSSCLVEGESFRCVCNSGFTGLPEEYGCYDINECVEGLASCDEKAICVNEIGSYTCHCNAGYEGDGSYCKATAAQAPQNVHCENYEDRQTCYCKQGFNLETADNEIGFNCVDINECFSTGASLCPPEAECHNLDGGFECRCKAGYSGDGYECLSDSQDCRSIHCPDNTYCEDSTGVARCVCREDPRAEPPECSVPTESPLNGSSTEERTSYDSCKSDSDCPENSLCDYNDTVGGYSCHCQDGYSFDSRYGRCLESRVSDPETPATPKTLPGGVLRTCFNGSCWCPPDFRDNGQYCVRGGIGEEGSQESRRSEQNEVTAPTYSDPSTCQAAKNCHSNALCIHLPDGKWQCMCKAGFEGDGFNCSETDISCSEADICHINATCIHDETIGKDICICQEGFQGDGTICYPENECVKHSDCPTGLICEFSNDKDAYECMCPQGYQKASNNSCVSYSTQDPPFNCNACHRDASCVKRRGVTDCECNPGFTGDGFNCEPEVRGCDYTNDCSAFAECLFNTTVGGYRCKCREAYEGDGLTCQPIVTCSDDPTMCHEQAQCVYLNGKFTCKCNEGYFGNGAICKAAKQQSEEFLLLGKGRSVLQIPFTPTPQNWGRPITIEEEQTAIGIAVDCVEGRVYWSDLSKDKIKRAKYDGSELEDFLTGVKSLEGLAIDWMNRKLYWADSSNDSIARVDLETKEIEVIISEGLSNPRGIAVHPWRRKLFWSDWKRDAPKIEMSNLDGSDRQVIVAKPNTVLPNSLSIDWGTDELCWADAGTKTIECLNPDRRLPRTVVSKCSYPFGLAITSDRYYWSDWHTLKVQTAPKYTGTPITAIDLPLGGSDLLYGLVAVSSCPS